MSGRVSFLKEIDARQESIFSALGGPEKNGYPQIGWFTVEKVLAKESYREYSADQTVETSSLSQLSIWARDASGSPSIFREG